MKTPEGKLKDDVKAYLRTLKNTYWYMPVPMGMGRPTVDFLCCIQGRFVAIETKAPGKQPTPRQLACLREVQQAGGLAFCADNMEAVRFYLRQFEEAENVSVERLVMVPPAAGKSA